MRREREGKMSLDDVLLEFAVAADQPTPKLLDEFVRRYPDYAEDLTAFSVRFAVQAIREKAGSGDGQEVSRDDETSVLRAMSSFQNRLYELRQKDVGATASIHDASADAEDPFDQMKVEGLNRLAHGLHANRTFALKVRDCAIKEETITSGFSRRVAEVLEVPVEIVMTHLSKPLRGPSAQRFKATEKPAGSGKQDFVAAVRGSGLSQEQQEWLLAL
jgi:hypothetical protein